jgi:hypothetical protein
VSASGGPPRVVEPLAPAAGSIRLGPGRQDQHDPPHRRGDDRDRAPRSPCSPRPRGCQRLDAGKQTGRRSVRAVFWVSSLFSRESPRERRGRRGKATAWGRRRRPRPTPPRSGAEPNRPPHREPAEDRPRTRRFRTSSPTRAARLAQHLWPPRTASADRSGCPGRYPCRWPTRRATSFQGLRDLTRTHDSHAVS